MVGKIDAKGDEFILEIRKVSTDRGRRYYFGAVSDGRFHYRGIFMSLH